MFLSFIIPGNNTSRVHKLLLFFIPCLFIACQDSENKGKDSDYYRSVADSIHAAHIESNLIPMYSIAGNVHRMTIPEMMEQDKIPGMSIAFVDKGQIAWTKHYGYANLEDSIPISSETVFTGASLSKPIAAIAALSLVEKGLLDLDEDVNRSLKEWEIPATPLTEKEKVTLRRLIGHKAGIKNDLWSNYLPGETVPTLNQLLAGEAPSVEPEASVIHVPGSNIQYSNTGYSIIQKLLMDVKNEAFDQLIDQIVFDPVGMENSSFKQPIPNHLKERKALGYTKELEAYPYRIFPYQAAGGIWTTPKDLAKFMMALLDDHHNGSHTLISKEITQSIFTKETARYVFPLWNWGNDVVFQHFGSNQGFNSFMYGSVDKNQGIVVMTNSDNAFGLFDYIQRAVNDEYQWEYVKPEILTPIEAEIPWIDSFLGAYQWRGSKLTLTMNKQDLFLRIDEEQYALTQTGEQEFVLSEIPLKITFSNDPDDYFFGMTIWGPGGGPSTLEKLDQ